MQDFHAGVGKLHKYGLLHGDPHEARRVVGGVDVRQETAEVGIREEREDLRGFAWGNLKKRWVNPEFLDCF